MKCCYDEAHSNLGLMNHHLTEFRFNVPNLGHPIHFNVNVPHAVGGGLTTLDLGHSFESYIGCLNQEVVLDLKYYRCYS